MVDNDKMRDMKEKGTKQVVDFDPVIYDDDLYLNDCKSLKRRLLIAEKLTYSRKINYYFSRIYFNASWFFDLL